MTIDFTKSVQTKSGNRVEIKFTDGLGEYPVAGYILFWEEGPATLEVWTENGSYYFSEESHLDLINVPAPKKRVRVEVRLVADSAGCVMPHARMSFEGRLPWTEYFANPVAVAFVDMEYEERE